MKLTLIAFGLLATFTLVGSAAQAPATKAPKAPATKATAAKAPTTKAPAKAAQRFEVTSIKAVRPTLVRTIAALEKEDGAGARAAFDAYDSGWNGIEVYINVRSADMYAALEKNYQTRIAEGLKAPKPDTAKLLPDAKAMLAKYDEAITMVEAGAPLNRLYDDVAHLRIVRAHLREVNPALKAGDVAKARKSFGAFNDTWDDIENLIKERSSDAYVAIESGMIKIEQGLKPKEPNVDEVTALVTDITTRYNAILAMVANDAKAAQAK
jgi:hypothetical protein